MSHTNNLSYEFGPYQLDLTKRVLSCRGETISLTPKATETLIKLVANAGQLVEKDVSARALCPIVIGREVGSGFLKIGI